MESVQIKLTPGEELIFKTLEGYTHLVIYGCEGWVRDKILGRSSSKINLVCNPTTYKFLSDSLNTALSSSLGTRLRSYTDEHDYYKKILSIAVLVSRISASA